MNAAHRQLALIALAFIAFISLGLPDGVLGVAWPSVRATHELPVSWLGALLPCGTAAYLIVSSLSGAIERRIGVGWLLAVSTATAGAGLGLFATAPEWWWLLIAVFLGGLGGGGIDAGLNAFAAERFSTRVMSWLHACYGIGATLGPLLMTWILVRDLSWRWGYGVLALAMGLLALLFLGTIKLWRVPATGHPAEAGVPRATMRATLRLPLAWVQIGVFWTYCGVEVGAGQLAYTVMTEGRGVHPEVAGPVVGGYWAALTAGRIVFGQIAARWSRDAILRVGTLAAPVGIACFSINAADWISFAGLWILGFALAPIFPMMVSATPDRLGRAHGPNAVGFQMSAASLGVAILPGLGAVLMRWLGNEVLGLYLLMLAVAVLILHETAIRMASPAPDGNAENGAAGASGDHGQ